MPISTMRILVMVLISAGALSALNVLGLNNDLYNALWWYDIVMHALGGFVIAGLSAWVLIRLMRVSGGRRLVALVLLATLAVGVGWEVLEYLAGWFEGVDNIVGDTALDLVMDMLGGFAAVLLVLKSMREEDRASNYEHKS